MHPADLPSRHLLRRTWAAATSVLVLAAALAACGTGDETVPDVGPTGAVATLSAAPVEMTPAEPDACLADGVATADVGSGLTATRVAWAGSGTHGVVLSPQAGGDVCQWADELVRLASQGYLVATFTWGSAPEQSVRGAADLLRATGAQDVALVGASLGGAWSAALGEDLDAAAVVALSPPATYGDLDAAAAAQGYDGPMVVVVSTDDADVPADESAQVAPDPEDLVELSGSAHGVALLAGEHGDEVRALVDETLATGFAG